jgi:hypothetical protein
MTWFDPDAIRGDFEKTLTNLFYPSAFNPLVNYSPQTLVRFNGLLFVNSVASFGPVPPSYPWEEAGEALKPIYENVESELDPNGALRIQISWGGTSNESIGCIDGALRSIEGALTCWIFTPKNKGTRSGLINGARLRRILSAWNSSSDCGEQVRAYTVRGPSVFQLPKGSDFYAQIVSCSLTAMERVSGLRRTDEDLVTIILDGDFL